MAQQVFITYIDSSKHVALSNKYNVPFGLCIHVNKDILSSADLVNVAKQCTTEFFYIVHSNTELDFTNFDFSFKPPAWDKEYIHIWNNDTRVRLYNKSLILEDPNKYSDARLVDGTADLKVLYNSTFSTKEVPIIFLSYNELYANNNYQILKDRFPRAKRVDKITGIFSAHKAAAEIADRTGAAMFYAVDADAEILPTFNFDYCPDMFNAASVHVWHSRNPINGLEYGYGGVKLFPTTTLLAYAGSPIDFTTSVSAHFNVINEISNITRFNTDPFSTWRSAFRESAKLASKLIINQSDDDTEHRLGVWCTEGADKEFGIYAIKGANEGANYGKMCAGDLSKLALINDYKWLEHKFSN